MPNTNRTLLLLALFLTGCNSQPGNSPAGADAGSGNWSWHDSKQLHPESGNGGVSASWGSWHKKFAYIILTDPVASASTSTSASGARTEFKVQLTLPKERKADFRIETADGKTGNLAYEGRSYDLAQGQLFILLPKGDKLEMVQLKRDLADTAAGPESLERLLKGDDEIARIFAKSR